MYIEHPYKYDGKYYANVDGKMIEITKEVAYAMNNFYRSSQPRKVEIKNEKGEVVERKLREIPYSETNGQDYEFSIEDFPDYSCDVEDSVISSVERRDIHKVINQLDAEERMVIYSIYFENKTQVQLADYGSVPAGSGVQAENNFTQDAENVSGKYFLKN